MKIWSDISVLFKIAFGSLFLGFLLGFGLSAAMAATGPLPVPAVSATAA